MKFRGLFGRSDAHQAAEAKAKRLTQQGQHVAAGRLMEKHGLLDQAAATYLNGGEYRSAADVLTRLGRHAEAARALKRQSTRNTPPLTNPALKAAEKSLQLGKTLDAARLFAQAGKWRRAADLYALSGFTLRAAEAFERAGDSARAAQAYEAHLSEKIAGGPGGQALAGEDHKAALKAGQLYARSGKGHNALQLLARVGLLEEAGDVAVSLERYADAADFFTRSDSLAKAAEAWTKAGEPVRAALARGELALRDDKTAEAARCFVEGHDFYRGAELYQGLGQFAEAGAAYEAGEAFTEAGQAFLEAGLTESAADAFERAQQFARAAQLRQGLGDTKRVASLYEQAGQVFLAGQAAAQAGDAKKAIALLQRVGAEDEHHSEATELLLQLFVAQGLPRLALERAQLLLGGQPPSTSNLGLYYWLAVSLEAEGDAAAAFDIYQKLLSIDFSYRDVAERTRRLASRSTAPPPAPPGEAARQPTPSSSAGTSSAQASTGAAVPVGTSPDSAAPVEAQSGAVSAANGKSASVTPAQAPPARETVGKQEAVGRYVTREIIGQGPLGLIHHAEDAEGRSVALRVLSDEAMQAPGLLGLLGDLTPARELSHPNLVKVISVGEHDGRPCVATELVRSRNMSDYLRASHRLSFKRCHALGRGLALALSFIHGKDLVHGSVRPSNVFVVSGIVKLADLGLGPLFRIVVPPDAYRAPENHLDVAGDVFSLGAVLYHLLTGREPPRSGAVPALPTKPSVLVPDVPASLDQLLLRALDPRPEARFKGAKEVLQALDAMVTIG